MKNVIDVRFLLTELDSEKTVHDIVQVVYDDNTSDMISYPSDDERLKEYTLFQIEKNTREFIKKEMKELKLFEEYKEDKARMLSNYTDNNFSINDALKMAQKETSKESLISVKYTLFEMPEMQEEVNKKIKTKIRRAKDIFEAIAYYHEARENVK